MRERKLVKKILSFCMVLGLVLGILTVPAEQVSATTANEKALEAQNAVVQVMVCAKNSVEDWVNIMGGSGFLVGTEENSQYVVTNDHVANCLTHQYMNDEGLSSIAEFLGVADSNKIEWKIRIVIKRDSYIDAEIVQNSAQSDVAILKMEQPIYGRTVLTLAPDAEVNNTENIYALGFPGIVMAYKNDQVYTSENVTTTVGTVSNVATSDMVTGSPIEYINHSAIISEGNSGGPLLNEDGYVIGVNSWYSGDAVGYYFSLRIKEVTDILDPMGIDYRKADSSEPGNDSNGGGEEPSSVVPEPSSVVPEPSSVVPEPSSVVPDPIDGLLTNLGDELSDAEDALKAGTYTQESSDALQQAIDDGKKVYNAGSDVGEAEVETAIENLKTAQKNLEEESGMGTSAIIGIVVAVVVLIVIIVLIVVISGNKKKQKAEEEKRKAREAAARQQRTQSSQGGFQQNTPFTPQNTAGYADEGSTPTGVLNEGSNATTVLGNNIPSASLIRRKTGEKVVITKAAFKIGKERRKVDYCISDNTNVSRTHADIVYKNGSFYILANITTNGTSVNGVTVAAGQERPLTGNEIIRLADEEFQFKLG